jgi:two-component system phosphate regulon sensor histidine kinase PhoR
VQADELLAYAGEADAVRKARSIIFYAWVALTIQAAVAAGMIAFLLASVTRPYASLGWIVAFAALAFAFTLPMVAIATGLRWVSVPLHTITDAVRKRTLGDLEARAVPGGPAEVRELATSLNRLADESNRLMTAELERGRLLAQVHRASVRIHEHLRADTIIKEAMTAIHEHLTVDFVQVGIITDERLTMAEGAADALGGAVDIVGDFPADSVNWMRDIYLHRSSYRVQDLGAGPAEEIPAGIKKILQRHGATSLLLTPFGAGQELLGCLTLLRTDRECVWTQPEIEAVELLAADIGRALEHARLYEGEQHLVAELQSVDRAKASFLASASHDLRTPLTSIIGYIELLSDEKAGEIPPERASMLQGVDRNARRLQDMVEDMLTTSKIELGSFAAYLRPFDLTGLLPAVADMFRPTAASSGITIEVTVPDRVVMIDGDPEQLDRLLVNLLSNAVKYTPRGGSVVLTLADDDGSAVLTVADTGIGIPKQDQGLVSTRFFRASNAIESAIPGSGLGLSIVHAIAANHHGEVHIESEQNRGTTVSVRLPLRAVERVRDAPGRHG